MASFNFKVDFHTDTTKSGLRNPGRAASDKPRVASAKCSQVAFLNSDRVASLQFGLGVASHCGGSMVGPPPAFCRSGRSSVAHPSSNL